MAMSAEIKDFITAFQGAYKMGSDASLKQAQMEHVRKQTAKLDDPDDAALKKAHVKYYEAAAQRAARGGGDEDTTRAINQERLRGIRMQNNAIQSQTEGANNYNRGLIESARPDAEPTPTPAPQGAIPTETPVAQAAPTGDEDGPTTEDSAIPASATLTSASTKAKPLDDSAAPEDDTATIGPAYIAAAKYNQGGGAAPRAGAIPGAGRAPAAGGRGLQNFYAGRGDSSPQQFKELKDTIDPKHEMGESQRNLTALAKTFKYHTENNEPEKAAKAANDILGQLRFGAQQYGHLATTLIDEVKAAGGAGTPEGKALMQKALVAAKKAYSNVPDGNDIEFSLGEGGKISYSLTGPDGKTINKGLMTPDEIAAQAMGVSSSGFDKFIMGAAGRQAAAGGKGKAEGAVPTIANRNLADKGIDAADEALAKTPGPDGKTRATPDVALQPRVKHIASLLTHDNAMMGEDLLAMTGKLVDVGEKNPDFKITRDKENGGGVARFSDGRTLNISPSAYQEIVATQGLVRAKIGVSDKKKAVEAGDRREKQKLQGMEDFEREGAAVRLENERPGKNLTTKRRGYRPNAEAAIEF